MPHVPKLFIDSRFALTKSEAGGVAQFEVDGGIQLRPEARCFLAEFTCPASWDTIDLTNLIFRNFELGTWRWVALEMGNYDMNSLATGLETLLNGPGKKAGMGTCTVAREGLHLKISCDTGSFEVPSDAKILAQLPQFSDVPSTNELYTFPAGAASEHLSSFVDPAPRAQHLRALAQLRGLQHSGPPGRPDHHGQDSRGPWRHGAVAQQRQRARFC